MKSNISLRYKQPKSKQIGSSNVKHDTDIGTLALTTIHQRKTQSKARRDKKI